MRYPSTNPITLRSGALRMAGELANDTKDTGSAAIAFALIAIAERLDRLAHHAE